MLFYDNYSLETLENENWLPLVGYEGRYEVSDLGRVKSVMRKDSVRSKKNVVIIKQTLTENGYLIVNLWDCNGKDRHKRVHIAVGEAFIPNPENKKDINHKKGVKIDNRASELEWNTRSENHKHAYRNKLRTSFWLGKTGFNHVRSKSVSQYKKDGTYIATFESCTEAGKSLGISDGHISSVCTGNRKTTGGYIWKYAS